MKGAGRMTPHSAMAEDGRWGGRLRSQGAQLANSCMAIPSSGKFSRALMCRTECVFMHGQRSATFRMKTKEKIGE